jgi:hypothetical protein
MDVQKHYIAYAIATVLLVAAYFCHNASPMKDDNKTVDEEKQKMYKNCSYACIAVAVLVLGGGCWLHYKNAKADRSLTSEIASQEMY